MPPAVGPLPPTLTEALRRSAARRPAHHPALAFYGQLVSYSPAAGRRWSGWLAFCSSDAGCSSGDRVLLDMQNSPHFVIAFHAILRAGGVVVPVNPMNLGGELEPISAAIAARALH